ncbi:hypothetical protein DFJ63DRAFT_314108 [Scheffersomyces coipomensis]|uniref:uncharacterized protein n=1 Tax=Scheffersomyces coipomensis TaxID=1788519 RepID=UPI00315D6CCF
MPPLRSILNDESDNKRTETSNTNDDNNSSNQIPTAIATSSSSSLSSTISAPLLIPPSATTTSASSSSDATSSTTAPLLSVAGKKPVARRACLSCREKKVKCDGEPITSIISIDGSNKIIPQMTRTCSNCKFLGIKCVFVQSNRGGRRKKRLSTDESANPIGISSDHEKRIKIEEADQPSQNQLLLPNPAPSTSQLVQQHANPPNFSHTPNQPYWQQSSTQKPLHLQQQPLTILPQPIPSSNLSLPSHHGFNLQSASGLSLPGPPAPPAPPPPPQHLYFNSQQTYYQWWNTNTSPRPAHQQQHIKSLLPSIAVANIKSSTVKSSISRSAMSSANSSTSTSLSSPKFEKLDVLEITSYPLPTSSIIFVPEQPRNSPNYFNPIYLITKYYPEDGAPEPVVPPTYTGSYFNDPNEKSDAWWTAEYLSSISLPPWRVLYHIMVIYFDYFHPFQNVLPSTPQAFLNSINPRAQTSILFTIILITLPITKSLNLGICLEEEVWLEKIRLHWRRMNSFTSYVCLNLLSHVPTLRYHWFKFNYLKEDLQSMFEAAAAATHYNDIDVQELVNQNRWIGLVNNHLGDIFLHKLSYADPEKLISKEPKTLDYTGLEVYYDFAHTDRLKFKPMYKSINFLKKTINLNYHLLLVNITYESSKILDSYNKLNALQIFKYQLLEFNQLTSSSEYIPLIKYIQSDKSTLSELQTVLTQLSEESWKSLIILIHDLINFAKLIQIQEKDNFEIFLNNDKTSHKIQDVWIKFPTLALITSFTFMPLMFDILIILKLTNLERLSTDPSILRINIDDVNIDIELDSDVIHDVCGYDFDQFKYHLLSQSLLKFIQIKSSYTLSEPIQKLNLNILNQLILNFNDFIS